MLTVNGALPMRRAGASRTVLVHSLLTSLALLLLMCLTPVAGAADGPSEYEVKAAFLQKFTSFIEWPHYVFPYDDSPFVIGILGSDPFGDVLSEVIADHVVNERSFVIRRWERASDVSHCQILFISDSEAPHLADILLKLPAEGLLTVSDIPDFAGSGGVIGFFVEENRMRFEVNIEAARKADLKISSKLLNLARLVGQTAKGDPK